MFARKNCLNCYFCTKCFRSPDDYQEKPFTLTAEQRAAVLKNDFSFIEKYKEAGYYLQCHKGQWSEIAPAPFQRSKLQKKKCLFFYPFKKGEGKFFPAIEQELQALKNARAEKLSRWSFRIAVVSIIISIAANADKIMGTINTFLNSANGG